MRDPRETNRAEPGTGNSDTANTRPDTGRIQPVVRRAASTTTISASAPAMMSVVVGCAARHTERFAREERPSQPDEQSEQPQSVNDAAVTARRGLHSEGGPRRDSSINGR